MEGNRRLGRVPQSLALSNESVTLGLSDKVTPRPEREGVRIPRNRSETTSALAGDPGNNGADPVMWD